MKNKHCYPTAVECGIESNGKILKTDQDIKDNCYCTMSELCKALLDMNPRDKESMIKCVHKMTDDQKDLAFKK